MKQEKMNPLMFRTSDAAFPSSTAAEFIHDGSTSFLLGGKGGRIHVADPAGAGAVMFHAIPGVSEAQQGKVVSLTTAAAADDEVSFAVATERPSAISIAKLVRGGADKTHIAHTLFKDSNKTPTKVLFSPRDNNLLFVAFDSSFAVYDVRQMGERQKQSMKEGGGWSAGVDDTPLASTELPLTSSSCVCDMAVVPSAAADRVLLLTQGGELLVVSTSSIASAAADGDAPTLSITWCVSDLTGTAELMRAVFINEHDDEPDEMQRDKKKQAEEDSIFGLGERCVSCCWIGADFVAAGTISGQVIIFDASTGKRSRVFKPHMDEVLSMRTLKISGEDFLCTVGARSDSQLKMWSVESLLKNHSSSSSSSSADPETAFEKAYSGSWDNRALSKVAFSSSSSSSSSSSDINAVDSNFSVLFVFHGGDRCALWRWQPQETAEASGRLIDAAVEIWRKAYPKDSVCLPYDKWKMGGSVGQHVVRTGTATVPEFPVVAGKRIKPQVARAIVLAFVEPRPSAKLVEEIDQLRAASTAAAELTEAVADDKKKKKEATAADTGCGCVIA